jgi:hypothetical protein
MDGLSSHWKLLAVRRLSFAERNGFEPNCVRSNDEPLCRIGSKLQARVAVEEERTSYQEASKEVQASDDILLVYLVELDDL